MIDRVGESRLRMYLYLNGYTWDAADGGQPDTIRLFGEKVLPAFR